MNAAVMLVSHSCAECSDFLARTQSSTSPPTYLTPHDEPSDQAFSPHRRIVRYAWGRWQALTWAARHMGGRRVGGIVGDRNRAVTTHRTQDFVATERSVCPVLMLRTGQGIPGLYKKGGISIAKPRRIWHTRCCPIRGDRKRGLRHIGSGIPYPCSELLWVPGIL
ncbi:hypothetical protein BDV95DRAFT_93626 [Massariosphaeria phaeospora]|uniref:Uncharacterized protein n=1 Tax=Massariosphaeria phaeospora TaxID=100035 RepID=A0A7C8I5S9_9PLEO|nr:hypothetical protein BDV95DRAFT_93626 [Massariosphaeria phaeospora]